MPDKSSPKTPAAREPGATPPPGRLWALVAVGVLILVAVATTLTRVWNFDVFWHLASGRWMIEHGRILDFDPFSVDPQAVWVNVHWGFQVIVTLLHSVGGFELLSVLKAALGAATVGVLVAGVRRNAPRGWMIFSGLGLLCMIAPRVRVRPEAFTLLFLMVTIALLEGVRKGGSPKRLWWIVPVMLVWANMHGLYVVGLGVIWASVIGAWIDRRMKRGSLSAQLLTPGALGPILTATIAVLVTPWPLEVLLYPILLWTRVSGSAFYYTYGVAELQPTWEALANRTGVIVLVLLTLGTMVGNRKQLPASHAIWFAAFVVLGLLARRNVGLAGPVVAYLLAFHGGTLLRSIAGSRPRWRRCGPPLTAGVMVLAVLVAAGATSSWIWWKLGWGEYRFGVGLLPNHYPVRTAKFLSGVPGEGNLLCDNFGDAGAFIYYSSPPRRMYMDGRLEAHSLERFDKYQKISIALEDVKLTSTVELPARVRFIFVRHDSQKRLNVLAQSKRFQLVYLDEAGAVFARTGWTSGFDKLPEVNFADFDRPLKSDWTIDGFGATRKTFWKQNPLSMNYQVGSMLTALGQYVGRGEAIETDAVRKYCTALAVRHLRAARDRSVAKDQSTDGRLAKSLLQLALQENALPSENFPVDVNLARALAIYSQMDLTDLDTPNKQGYAQYHIVALKTSGQLAAASKAMAEFLDNVPPDYHLKHNAKYLKAMGTKKMLETALEASHVKKARIDKSKLSTVEKARMLASQEIGLMGEAIELLSALPNPTLEESMTSGSLYLRQGDLAFIAGYIAVASSAADYSWPFSLALAMAEWIQGDLFEALRILDVHAQNDEPLLAYYHASLLEQLGRHEEARERLIGIETPNNDLGVLLKKLRKRLATK